MEQKQRAFAVAARNMVINCFLAVMKLTAGALSHSAALLSDGVHGVTDAVSATVVMVGIRLSVTTTDRRHPYGHERMECVAAVLLSVAIGAVGLMLGISGVQALASPQTVASPGALALVAAALSVVVKEIMFRVTRREAVRTGSSALMADAWHQRTDVFTSLGTLLGVGGAWLGCPLLDPLAACVISLLIIRAAVLIFADAMRRMTDRATDEETETQIIRAAEAVDGVTAVEAVRTRLFGCRVLAEVTVCVDDTLSSLTAYAVMRAVSRAVEGSVPAVKECAVHIHPIAVANRERA